MYSRSMRVGISVLALTLLGNLPRTTQTAQKKSSSRVVPQVWIGQDFLQELGHPVFEPWGLAFSPDSHQVYSSLGAWQYKVFELESGQEQKQVSVFERPLLGTDNGAVINEFFLASLKELVISCTDQMIRVHDPITGKKIRAFDSRPFGQTFADLRYSKQGKWVIGRGLSQIRVWDLESGKEQKRYERRETELDLHPDGQHVVTIGDDHIIRVWNAKTGVPRSEFADLTQKLQRVKFSPDGNEILCWSKGSPELYVVNPRDGSAIFAFEHPANVIDAAYFPNRLWIASCGADRILRVWGRDNGRLLYSKTFQADLRRIGISPDGKHVVIEFTKELFIYKTKFYETPPTKAQRKR